MSIGGKDIVVLANNKSCPLCGNHDHRPFRKGLLKCIACGGVFNPQVWDEGANKAHEEEWFENNPIQETFWDRLFQSWNNRRTWQLLKEHMLGRLKVLEVGVGSGALLRFLRLKDFEVEGCDLSRTICELIRNSDGILMHNCPIDKIPDSTSYDAVVMSHVLEHVNDPVQFLKDVQKRLKVGAPAYISVPNIKCWEAILPGWNSYEPYHLVYFSPKTLRRTVELAGFQVLGICSHDSFSGWFLAILRTLLKTYDKSPGKRFAQRETVQLSWVSHMYRLGMILSGAITLPLRKFQGAIKCGDEVVLIARKTD